MDQRPKVSVVVQTLNHESYVAEALESVLMQRVDFPIEVLVGDDYSTDRTREIITEYAQRRRDMVKTVFPGARMRHSGGLLYKELLARATGEFVAVLDGDDFWIREDKLRVQVAALEARPDSSACFHDAVVFHEDGSRPGRNYGGAPQEDLVTIDDLLGAWNVIPTCSVVYRNRGLAVYPDWLWATPCLDWAQHILNARSGDLTYVSESMAAYRIHRHPMSSQLDRIRGLELKLDMLSKLTESLPSRHLDQLDYGRSKVQGLIAIEKAVPSGDHSVLVAWDGDSQLLELDGREAWPFPLSDGRLKPADGPSAVRDLEQARADGAEFLVIPAASRWWLTYLPEFAAHLDQSCARIWSDRDMVIYRLEAGAG